MNLYGKSVLASLLIVSIASYAEPPAVTLYLLGYEIPKEQRLSVVKQDIAAFTRYQQKRIDATFMNPIEQDSPISKRDDYARINTNDLTLCDFKEPNKCLAQIKINPEPYRLSIQTLAPVFKDFDALRQSDSSELKSVFPASLQLASTPLIPYQMMTKTLLTRNALTYHDNPEQALTQICADVTFGKSMLRSQQNLIQSLVSTAIVHSQLDLLAQSSQPLPSSCQEALRPMIVADISVCSLMKAESQFMANEMMETPNIPILFSRSATTEQITKQLQPYCDNQRLEGVSNDQLMTPPPVEEYNPIIFNKIGAIVLNISKPDYTVYQHRLQDVNAHLRLWQTALDPQCTTATNRYVKLISDKWDITRQLRLDNRHLR